MLWSLFPDLCKPRDFYLHPLQTVASETHTANPVWALNSAAFPSSASANPVWALDSAAFPSAASPSPTPVPSREPLFFAAFPHFHPTEAGSSMSLRFLLSRPLPETHLHGRITHRGFPLVRHFSSAFIGAQRPSIGAAPQGSVLDLNSLHPTNFHA